MEREEEVFVDAEEEITPRRSGRKRRSTAGTPVPSQSATKRSRSSRMPTARSPGSGQGASGSGSNPRKGAGTVAEATAMSNRPDTESDDFWTKLGGLLGGMEARLKQGTNDVKDQLGQAIGDLGSRVERSEKRLGEFAEEVDRLVDKRLATTLGNKATHLTPASVVEPGPAPDPSGHLNQSVKSYTAALLSGGAGWKDEVTKKPVKSKEEDYWRCRRALRLRPINTNGDGTEAVRDFMTTHLGLDDHQVPGGWS